MKIEQQVTSLELSIKLKELGVRQESYFDWYLWDDEEYTTVLLPSTKKNRRLANDFCSAFTVAELGEMLPWYTHKGYLTFDKGRDGWMVMYCTLENQTIFGNGERDENLADAVTKMLIYLIENKLLDITE